MAFPGIAQRYHEASQWFAKNQGLVSLFGLFWNLCINATFEGQSRVHCRPHTDSKNVVGVCALLVYVRPGGEPILLISESSFNSLVAQFDHKKHTWLVLWEGKVAIELPPWVVFLYPSSLFAHFNIDIGGEYRFSGNSCQRLTLP